MPFSDLLDLASARLGGAVIAANDEFFAPKEALLKPEPAEWREGLFTERGKWMDGWETRRRRVPGYDWCLVRLGVPGVVRGVVIDTSFFRGNYPDQCSIEGCALPGTPGPAELLHESTVWVELLQRVTLDGDRRNSFAVGSDMRVSHLRLNIFPDGGVARLRVHGEARPDWTGAVRAGGEIDLAAAEHGGRVIRCSDMFFGDRQNLIMPGRSTHMGDGWETRRRRGAGNDWSVIKLARRGTLHRIELDTDHFKGNAPGACMLEACDAPEFAGDDVPNERWKELLPRTPLQPHTRHRFEDSLLPLGPMTHVRLNIYPDGGVGRLRLFGSVAREAL